MRDDASKNQNKGRDFGKKSDIYAFIDVQQCAFPSLKVVGGVDGLCLEYSNFLLCLVKGETRRGEKTNPNTHKIKPYLS